MTSFGISNPSAFAFLFRIAILVSKSGGVISVIKPHSKRDRRRSSSVGISFGGRSLEIIICLFSSCNALNVWKNSRSEEHTSELQSRFDLVCRLLLEKKKIILVSYSITF